jgi:hypothetical protein
MIDVSPAVCVDEVHAVKWGRSPNIIHSLVQRRDVAIPSIIHIQRAKAAVIQEVVTNTNTTRRNLD